MLSISSHFATVQRYAQTIDSGVQSLALLLLLTLDSRAAHLSQRSLGQDLCVLYVRLLTQDPFNPVLFGHLLINSQSAKQSLCRTVELQPESGPGPSAGWSFHFCSNGISRTFHERPHDTRIFPISWRKLAPCSIEATYKWYSIFGWGYISIRQTTDSAAGITGYIIPWIVLVCPLRVRKWKRVDWHWDDEMHSACQWFDIWC